jgi:hypothetical protein
MVLQRYWRLCLDTLWDGDHMLVFVTAATIAIDRRFTLDRHCFILRLKLGLPQHPQLELLMYGVQCSELQGKVAMVSALAQPCLHAWTPATLLHADSTTGFACECASLRKVPQEQIYQQIYSLSPPSSMYLLHNARLQIM